MDWEDALQNTASIEKDMTPVLLDLVRLHILHFYPPYFRVLVPYGIRYLVVQADIVIQAVFGRNAFEVAENLTMSGITGITSQVKIQTSKYIYADVLTNATNPG